MYDVAPGIRKKQRPEAEVGLVRIATAFQEVSVYSLFWSAPGRHTPAVDYEIGVRETDAFSVTRNR